MDIEFLVKVFIFCVILGLGTGLIISLVFWVLETGLQALKNMKNI